MEAVDNLQKKILTELMNMEILNDYFLVGGTNLALRENHRKSIDLDLFIMKDYDLAHSNYINLKLKKHFSSRYTNTEVSNVGVFGGIDGVKVDFINFPYSLLKPIEYFNGYRLASELDVVAMKINAVSGRGSRKDFYDLEKLFNKYSINESLNAYQKMYKIDTLLHIQKSLLFFDDADNTTLANNKVVSLERKSWKQIKYNIQNSLKNYAKIISEK